MRLRLDFSFSQLLHVERGIDAPAAFFLVGKRDRGNSWLQAEHSFVDSIVAFVMGRALERHPRVRDGAQVVREW